MPISNKYAGVSRDLLLPLRYDTLSVLGEEGWISLNRIPQLDFAQKLDINEACLIEIGLGAGSMKDAPIYETNVEIVDSIISSFAISNKYTRRIGNKITIH